MTGGPSGEDVVQEPRRNDTSPDTVGSQPLPKASGEARHNAVVVIELYSGILPGARAVGRLGLQITAKYFCKVDDDSTLVAMHQHPDASNLGSIEALSKEKIIALTIAHPKELFIVLACPASNDNVSQLKNVLADFVAAVGDRLVYAVNMIPPRSQEEDLMSARGPARRRAGAL